MRARVGAALLAVVGGLCAGGGLGMLDSRRPTLGSSAVVLGLALLALGAWTIWEDGR